MIPTQFIWLIAILPMEAYLKIVLFAPIKFLQQKTESLLEKLVM